MGRGGKRGTYSGRGIKGQKSRAGNRPRPAIRDLILRTPKLRGASFANTRRTAVYAVPLERINARFDAGEIVSPKSLRRKKLIPRSASGRAIVKVLHEGSVTKALHFQGVALSAKARAAIEARGGSLKGL